MHTLVTPIAAEANMPNKTVTEKDWKQALKQNGGKYSRTVAENPKLTSMTFDIIREIGEKHYGDASATALLGAGELAGKAIRSDRAKLAIKSTSFVVSQFKASMALRVVSNLSPGKALVTIGATTVFKTGLILDMAGEDHKKMACTGAIMEVGSNAAITAVTSETGVGLVLGIAATAASALEAYRACKDK